MIKSKKFLFNNIDKFSKNTAVEFNNKKITYNDIIKFGSNLGISKNDKKLILIICEYNLDLILGYVNFIRFNQLVFLAGNDLLNNQYINIIQKYRPQYIYLPITKYKKYNFKNFALYEKFNDYCFLKYRKKNKYSINKNLSLLLMTSGSTGDPNTVRISNENIMSNTDSITKNLKIKSKDIAITTLPMNYSLGMSIINTHLHKGATIVLNKHSFFEKKFWDILKIKKVTTFTGVPFNYEILFKMGIDKKKLPYIKYLTQAGGKLDQKLTNFFNNKLSELKIKFYIMYGQTEASPRMSYLNHKDISKHQESIGKPLKGTYFRLIDKFGKIINSINTNGELCYFGKNVCHGYAKNYLDLNKDDQNKGVLFTGDIAYKDKNNFFYIVGRKKRFTKISGKRINLDYLEELFIKKNIQVACSSDNEILNLYHEKKSVNKSIFMKVLKLTNIHYSHVNINYIKKIPRTANGKIDYKKLN